MPSIFFHPDPKPFSQRPHMLLKHVKHILDREMAAQKLFSISETQRLSYTICRKKKGLYTIGVFNDSLKRTPFKIKSHIGNISKIEEIILDDEFIKTEFYPGEYGEGIEYFFTDSEVSYLDMDKNRYKELAKKREMTHILGGDVRLFSVYVNEEGLEVLKENNLPPLPEKKILYFKSMRKLRDKLFMLPSFFEYFSGISVSGASFNKIDIAELKRMTHWFNRKKLEILIDAREIFEEKEINDILNKASLLKQAKTILVASDFNDSVQKKAKSLKIKFVDMGSKKKNPYFFLSDLLRFEDSPNNSSKTLVLDFDYQSWDDIIKNLEIAEEKIGARRKLLIDRYKKNLKKNNNLLIKTTKRKNANRYLNLRDINSLKEKLEWVPNFFDHFGGIVLEASYLHGFEKRELLSQKKWLDDKKIDVMVDFSALINDFKDISYYQSMGVVYKKGIAYLENVFEKMQQLKIKDALMITSPDKIMNKIKIRGRGKKKRGGEAYLTVKTMLKFCEIAKKYGIKIHLRNSMRANWEEIEAYVSYIKRKDYSVKNLKGAYSTIRAIDPNVDLRNVEIVLLSSSSSDEFFNTLHPYYQKKNDKNKLNFLKKLKRSRKTKIVFDAEYLTPDEITREVKLLKTN